MFRVLLLVSLLFSPALWAQSITLEHNDLTLNGELKTSDENWQQGPVFLLVHGTLAHNQMEIMATLQEILQERGYSSLAITLSLGQSNRTGMYDCAKPHTHTMEDAVREIRQWLGWLKVQGAQSVVVLGHSRGGNQVARFAAAHDEPLVKDVILMAPMTWEQGKNLKDYKKRYGRRLEPLLETATELVKKGRGDKMMKPVDFLYCEQTAATAASLVSYYRASVEQDTPSLLSRIHKPTLLIAGSEDDVVEGLAAKVEAKAPGANVQLVEIEGAGHFFRDLYAEEAVDAIEEFIAVDEEAEGEGEE